MSIKTNNTASESSSNAMLLLITRLHFYIGLFIGPFIFVAALTGTIYVITPQIEDAIYKDALTTQSVGEPQPLALQIAAAKSQLATDLTLFAVRPAPKQGDTTRVMFLDSSAEHSGARAIFVDPITLDITGNLPVYGTSGVLPLRTTIDFMHRQLLLGEFGRYYSELAASWLWIAALGGLFLWYKGGKKNKAEFANKTEHLRKRRRHYQVGLCLFVGLIFVSVTGLTWSKWAGANIGTLRSTIGWVTPSVDRDLSTNSLKTMTSDEHADHLNHASHQGMTATKHVAEKFENVDLLFDGVLKAARDAGIDANKLEIKPSSATDKAWFVREIDRSWPTQVDSVAIDANTMTVTSRADFATFPIVAKLIRWGIDAHMGILFGVVNQIILTAFGLSLCFMIIWGYRMWWIRRPQAGSTSKPLLQAWARMSTSKKWVTSLIAIALGFSLPVMGVSLLAFLFIDFYRWKRQ
ncbi:PepSY domain-containing protein [Marinomonas rhizomae]|uniref:Putative iron-regulated membrane protein n=1 Tax=Marinomonas rhizomae TaxID=491948 RepID=A0A366J3L4_9GAMM|nr:PepSY-associated TM helix domain-containing protein [Marinomonas rhizomae]RBP80538.1 putative iron-regulated membrane protein [Marinomonas rhizomae]RNF71773.1 PepSY domain-containing protein [Marinomonas rhizomae]